MFPGSQQATGDPNVRMRQLMDMNVHAFRLVREATEESSLEDKRKRAASRRGGLSGGQARAKALSPEERKAIAVKASQARWNRVEEVAV